MVLVKVEEVELVTGAQSQPGLSIQEGEQVDLTFLPQLSYITLWDLLKNKG